MMKGKKKEPAIYVTKKVIYHITVKHIEEQVINTTKGLTTITMNQYQKENAIIAEEVGTYLTTVPKTFGWEKIKQNLIKTKEFALDATELVTCHKITQRTFGKRIRKIKLKKIQKT